MSQRTEVPRDYMREVPLLGATTTLGSEVRAQFSGIEKELAGFPLHVLGFLLRMVITVNTVANTMGAACPGEKLYDAFARVRWSFGNHHFVRDMRGAVLKQIERALGLRSMTGAVASDLADADATGTSITLDLWIPAALPRPCPGGELDGVFPVAALRDEDFSFTLPSASSIPHSGVTVATVTSCAMYAKLIPLAKLRVPTGFTNREVRRTELVFTEEGSGFWDCAMVTKFTTENDALSCADFTGIRIAIGSGQLRETTSAALTLNHNLRQLGADAGADTESTTAPEVLFVVEPISTNPGRMMTRQPSGPIKLEITARPSSVTRTDFAYRARGVRYQQYLETMRQRLGAPERGITSTVLGARKGRTPADLIPCFDAAWSWPGMSFGVPNANQ